MWPLGGDLARAHFWGCCERREAFRVQQSPIPEATQRLRPGCAVDGKEVHLPLAQRHRSAQPDDLAVAEAALHARAVGRPTTPRRVSCAHTRCAVAAHAQRSSSPPSDRRCPPDIVSRPLLPASPLGRPSAGAGNFRTRQNFRIPADTEEEHVALRRAFAGRRGGKARRHSVNSEIVTMSAYEGSAGDQTLGVPWRGPSQT